MISKQLPNVKEDERWSNYTATGFQLFFRGAGTIAGDNDQNQYEHIYFISWEATITLKDEIEKITAPCEFIFPANTYHKIEAHTNIIFLILQET